MTKPFDISLIPNLRGKVAIVTGGNGGIGYQTTFHLAQHGARVYMASRNEEKAKKAIDEMEKGYEKQEKKQEGVEKLDVRFVKLDLMDLASCKNAGEEFLRQEKRLDILVCNAGIMAEQYDLTKDGAEKQFQTNHLSHFALFHPLAPTMIQTAHQTGHPSRVVCLTSIAHTFLKFNPFVKLDFTSKEKVNRSMGGDTQVGRYMRYGQSKIANLLFAREVNKRFQPNEIRAVGVHPGFVASNLYEGTPLKPFAHKIFISSEQGALSTLYAATSAEIEEKNGWDEYYVTGGVKGTDYSLSRDPKLMDDLWTLSEEWTGLKFDKVKVDNV